MSNPAIEPIKKQLSKIDELLGLPYDDPRQRMWHDKTRNCLEELGNDDYVSHFESIWSPGVMLLDEHSAHEDHMNMFTDMKIFLEAIIKEEE